MKIISESDEVNKKREKKLIIGREAGEGMGISDRVVRKGAS